VTTENLTVLICKIWIQLDFIDIYYLVLSGCFF